MTPSWTSSYVLAIDPIGSPRLWRVDDDGYAISYKLLERGVPVVTADGAPEYQANLGAGRLSRLLGRGWKRR